MTGPPLPAKGLPRHYANANVSHSLVASGDLRTSIGLDQRRHTVLGLIRGRLNRSKALVVLDPQPIAAPEPLRVGVDDFADTSLDELHHLTLSDDNTLYLLLLLEYQDLLVADARRQSQFVFSELFDELASTTATASVATAPTAAISKVAVPARARLGSAALGHSRRRQPPGTSAPPRPVPAVIDTTLANALAVSGAPKLVQSPDRLLGLSLLKLLQFRLNQDKLVPVESSRSGGTDSGTPPMPPPTNTEAGGSRLVTPPSEPPSGRTLALYQHGNRDSHQLLTDDLDTRLPDPDVLSTNTPSLSTPRYPQRPDWLGELAVGPRPLLGELVGVVRSESQKSSASPMAPMVTVATLGSVPKLPLMLRFSHGSDSMAEVLRDTIRLLMSLGELLTRLENYYEGDAEPVPEEVLLPRRRVAPPLTTIKFAHDELRGTETDLTAGVDAESELPITIYKVQGKDYDELTQRWLVYEHNRTRASATSGNVINAPPRQLLSESLSVGDTPDATVSQLGALSLPHVAKVLPPGHPYTLASYPVSTGTVGGTRLELHRLSLASSRAVQAPALAAALAAAVAATPLTGQSHLTHTTQTPLSQYTALTPSQLRNVILPPTPAPLKSLVSPALALALVLRQLPLAKQERVDPITELRTPSPHVQHPQQLVVLDHSPQEQSPAHMFGGSPNVEPFAIDLSTIEKGWLPHLVYRDTPKTYLWGHWLVMMVLGLIIIPIHFMIFLGVLDRDPLAHHQYLAMFYSAPMGKKPRTEKYTKAQKIASAVIGVCWLAIVIAMIIVGLVVGLTTR